MIKKLKRKVVTVTTTTVLIILVVAFSIVNIVNFLSIIDNSDEILTKISSNGGTLPLPDRLETIMKDRRPHKENILDTQYFIVYYNEKKEITGTSLELLLPLVPIQDQEYMQLFSIILAEEFTPLILKEDSTFGFIDTFRYMKTSIKGKNALIFLDRSGEMHTFYIFFYGCIIITVVVLLFTLLISSALAPIAIRPTIDAYEKQKKFITNASHELKTPLTVISANIEIMELTSGENKWSKNSKEQIARLTDLVNNLVSLSRIEELTQINSSNFSLSEMAEMVAESYESIAFSDNKKFITKIEDDIQFNGNEKDISQLFYILLDNAFKYCNDNGIINFCVEKTYNKKIISVTNTVENIEKGNHPEFFDRFYRADKSHNSEKSGFGIGLSLARSIVQAHKGKISAKSFDEKSLTIEVII